MENAMATVQEIIQQVRSLSPKEQEELARALTGGSGRGPDLPLASPAAVAFARPDVRDPVGWRKAEAGHAVLAVETPERDDEIPAGPEAIAGIWAGRDDLTLGRG
jgi:hypothetical protein